MTWGSLDVWGGSNEVAVISVNSVEGSHPSDEEVS